MTRPEPKPLDPQEVRALALEVIRQDRFPQLATCDGDQPRVRPVSPVRTEHPSSFYDPGSCRSEDGVGFRSGPKVPYY